MDPKSKMSFRRQPVRIQSLGYQSSPSMITDDTKTPQNTVTCLYQANIAGYWRNVSVLWSKNLINHSLTISVDALKPELLIKDCKIDLKPWHFWSRKGFKSFEVEGNLVQVFWDLRSAEFSTGPEPCSDYYVALVSDEEVVLLLGDYKKKAYKRTKSRPALVDAVLYYKRENVFAKKSFATRAKFNEREKKEHEIVVELSGCSAAAAAAGIKDPEMWISIDGVVVIHIRNLQWKFRGNEAVMVDKEPVQVFWDVHDWLFNSSNNNMNGYNGGGGSSSCSSTSSVTGGGGHGLFIFKPGEAATTDEREDEIENNSSSSNKCYSEFCLYLCAWKME